MIDFDPMAPSFLANPYPVYDKLRQRAPVFWSPILSGWVVSKYDDCKLVLKKHDVFARDLRRIGRYLPEGQDSIQARDPPHQTALRQAFVSSIHQVDIGSVVQRGKKEMCHLLSKHRGHGCFDLMHFIAAPVALQMTADLFGVKEVDGELIHMVFQALSRGMDAALYSKVEEEALEAADTLELLMINWLSAESSCGLISELRNTLPHGSINSSYFVYSLCAVFNACYSTIYAATGSCFERLLRENESFIADYLSAGCLHAAADEMLRFTSPAQITSRHAVCDTYINGILIKEGSAVIVLIAAANRDPDFFENPNELILNRSPNSHLGFGWGAHSCFGMQVVKKWITEVLSVFAAGENRVVLHGTPQFMAAATLRNINYLPVISL